MKLWLTLFAALFCASTLSAQSILFDTTIATTTAGVDANREDVRAIGMGRTQFANGLKFNAMMYNPAFLARKKNTVEINVWGGLPPETFDAANYLRQNRGQFTRRDFLDALQTGANNFITAFNAGDESGANAALQQIRQGLTFPQDVLNKVMGSSQNPTTHRVTVLPAIQVQQGNFGVSVYGNVQTQFRMIPNDLFTDLQQFQVPTSLSDPNAGENIGRLLNIATIALAGFQSDPKSVFPQALALSYVDLVGAAGYGFIPAPNLSVGITAKVVNRRASLKLIDAENYSDVLSEARRDLSRSVTGFTLDVGATYMIGSTGTRLAASVQNIIPVSNVRAVIPITVPLSDTTGNFAGLARINIPFEFKLPLLANIGVFHPFSNDWDASLDIADVLTQNNAYDTRDDKNKVKVDFVNRVRLGSEYRFGFTRSNDFGMALRAGMALKKFTAGLGFNFFRVVQIDGAYAYDGSGYVYFGQLRVGW
jgi:hypothetical protein